MRISILLSLSLPLVMAVHAIASDYVPRRSGRFDFPVYTNRPAGKQLSGQHAPATTPALSPEEAQKKFTLPKGFEIRLFASEPEVVNPVAMTWDERGRLWVLELYEYPLGAKNGQKPRDRIKILEDTDGDGGADKVTLFADGLNLATGLQLGNGGVYVGQAPEFLFLEDTDGDGKADKRTVLKTGFGLDDRHELLNGFTWGPDGWLYMTHGVFTHSVVKDPANPNDTGVKVDAAVARYHPRTKQFEAFADGTSNPWGVDFDRAGNAFVSACVIDHLFHMAPGGQYARQGGSPANPYGYELLPSIVDHKHKMAAYSGVQVYQGNQFPEEYRGAILMGNIHDNAIHQDRLTPNGSSFKASFTQDFVRGNDGWFMPVSTQVGPDGAVWVMDWYDKYPCYQNANADPEGVDREFGRIWRVVYTGNNPGAPVPSRPEVKMDLAKSTSADLVGLLAHPNVWQRRMAQRLLNERRDPAIKPALESLLFSDASSKSLEPRLAALWTLHGTQLLDEAGLDKCVADREPAIRAWSARLTGERRIDSESGRARLLTLASDPDASVRLAVATAMRQFASGSLTVNTPLPESLAGFNPGPALAALVKSSSDAKDPLIPFLVWMAAEPRIARNPRNGLNWLLDNGAQTMPLSGQLAKKTMRRICDLQQPEWIDAAIQFAADALDKDAALAAAALEGLIEGQKGKALPPDKSPSAHLAKLAGSSNKEVVARAEELGTLWGDPLALARVLAKITDVNLPDGERLKAIRVARQTKNDATRVAVLRVLSGKNSDEMAVAGIQALSEIGGDGVATSLIEPWKSYSPGVRRAAAETLISRAAWRDSFLDAVEKKSIAAGDLSASVVRSLANSPEKSVRERTANLIGRFRESDADKLKLIAEKKRVVLSGEPDLKAGHELAAKTCLICHKLHGEGAEVGPDLTGVGRSTLDALLANVIDPNQIVGKGYENTEIETKDGRSVSGRIVEDTDTRIKLLSAGPKEEVIAKSDIATMRTTELSVMPEGLEQLPEADFRNLIWYILNPPQDNRPWTPALRKELIGDDKAGQKRAQTDNPVDGESVALWNPEWRVICPPFEGAPAKLPEYAGRHNVLMTHPASRTVGAALERLVEVPAGKKAELAFAVAAHEKGDWKLRVLADGKVIHEQVIDKSGERWKQIRVDLTPYAGKKVALRLENVANDWSWEFGYWSDLELKVASR